MQAIGMEKTGKGDIYMSTTDQSIGKKALSVLLALAMALFLVPSSAWAVDEGSGEQEPATTNVAQIGETGYATLDVAIEAAEEGATITLLKDVATGIAATDSNTGANLWVKKSLTLDLGGKTLSSNYQIALGINADGINVTVQNGTINAGSICSVYLLKGTVTLKAIVANGYFDAMGDSTLLLDEGTVINKTGQVGDESWPGRYAGYCEGNSKVTIANGATVNGLVCVWGTNEEKDDDGNVTTAKETPTLNVYGTAANVADFAISTNGTDKSGPNINVYEGAKVISTSATIKDDEENESLEEAAAMYIPSSGEVNIYGGEISGAGSGISFKAGTLNISGGVISSDGTYHEQQGYSNGSFPTGAAIQIESNIDYDYGNVNISGGTIESTNNSAILEYLANNNTTSDTMIRNISITGGEFSSAADKDVIKVSDELVKKENGIVISAGTYSNNPNAKYLKSDYAAVGLDSLYIVTDKATADASSAIISDEDGNVSTVNGQTVLAGSLLGLVDDGASLTVSDEKGNKAVLDSQALNAILANCSDKVLDKVAVEVSTKNPSGTDIAAVKDLGEALFVVSADALINGVNTSVQFDEDGSATVTVPYETDSNSTYSVYYIDDKGTPEEMDLTFWGPKDISFTTNHFSEFIVVKDAVEPEPTPDPDPEPTPDSTPEPTPDPTPEATTVQIYRLYNQFSSEHLYTQDKNEYDVLVSYGWTGEGEAWVAPKTSDVAVYRLYNPFSGDHLYTSDKNEYTELQKIGWKGEDVAFYSASKEDGGDAIYRLFNPNETIGTHHLTSDKNEYTELQKIGWKGEDIAFYAAKVA
jgi:hypothetical protein